MTVFHGNIEDLTVGNENFRKVIFTASHSQLVLMSLLPNEDIGMEVHQNVDQFFRIEVGEGIAVVDDVEYPLSNGTVIFVPSGHNHNIINTSATERLKFYTIYSPANHPDGVVHATKRDALLHPDE